MMAQAEIPLFVPVLHHYDLTLPSNSQLLCKTSIVTNKKLVGVSYAEPLPKMHL